MMDACKRFALTLTLTFIIPLAAAVLVGCDGGGNANQAATPGTGNGKAGVGSAGGPGAVTYLPCPKAADVAGVVGAPVELKIDRTSECYYQTPDFKTSVTIMGFPADRADKHLKKMKVSAKPYGAEVEEAGLGERSYVLAAGISGEGLVVAGGRGYWLGVSWTGGGGVDKKEAVIKLLKLLDGVITAGTSCMTRLKFDRLSKAG